MPRTGMSLSPTSYPAAGASLGRLDPRRRVRLGPAHPILPEVPLRALRFWWHREAGRPASDGVRIFGCEPSYGFWSAKA